MLNQLLANIIQGLIFFIQLLGVIAVVCLVIAMIAAGLGDYIDPNRDDANFFLGCAGMSFAGAIGLLLTAFMVAHLGYTHNEWDADEPF